MAATDDERTLARLADAVLRVARELDPHTVRAAGVVPLSGVEAAVIRWIDRAPGTTASDAAEATGLKRSNLSAAVRSLVEKGLVDRRTDAADARIVRLHPTDHARDTIDRLHAHWATRLRDAVGDRLDLAAAAADLLHDVDDRLRLAPDRITAHRTERDDD